MTGELVAEMECGCRLELWPSGDATSPFDFHVFLCGHPAHRAVAERTQAAYFAERDDWPPEMNAVELFTGLWEREAHVNA